jgi:RNA polymerase sigma-70 factor, ECF subfamily
MTISQAHTSELVQGQTVVSELSEIDRNPQPVLPLTGKALHGQDVAGPDLAQHRTALLRFAKRKVRDEALAEDAVQDTLVAALIGIDRFQGQSALRTWLFGILNHKIQDIFRREGRYVSMSNEGDEDEDRDYFERLPMTDMADPADFHVRNRFLQALEKEVDALPPTLKEVFMMQAIEDRTTEEVCEELKITEANCWVRLHRARKQLNTRLAAHMV